MFASLGLNVRPRRTIDDERRMDAISGVGRRQQKKYKSEDFFSTTFFFLSAVFLSQGASWTPHASALKTTRANLDVIRTRGAAVGTMDFGGSRAGGRVAFPPALLDLDCRVERCPVQLLLTMRTEFALDDHGGLLFLARLQKINVEIKTEIEQLRTNKYLVAPEGALDRPSLA